MDMSLRSFDFTTAFLLLGLFFLTLSLPTNFTNSHFGPPAVVVVPDAFYRAMLYSFLGNYLADAGYDTAIRTHPSCAAENPRQQTAGFDKAFLRYLIEPLLDANRPVVLVMHGYGCLIGSAAAKGWSIIERLRDGSAGGVLGLICIAGPLGLDGESYLDLLPRRAWRSWMVERPDDQIMVISGPTTLFNPLPLDLASRYAGLLGQHSKTALTSNPGPPAWQDAYFNDAKAYLFCMQDFALPVTLQERWSTESGRDWSFMHLRGGHSPFLTDVGGVSDFVIRMIIQWKEGWEHQGLTVESVKKGNGTWSSEGVDETGARNETETWRKSRNDNSTGVSSDGVREGGEGTYIKAVSPPFSSTPMVDTYR